MSIVRMRGLQIREQNTPNKKWVAFSYPSMSSSRYNFRTYCFGFETAGKYCGLEPTVRHFLNDLTQIQKMDNPFRHQW